MATCVQKNASIQVFNVPKATCTHLKMTLCEIDPRYFILLFIIYVCNTHCVCVHIYVAANVQSQLMYTLAS